MSNPSKGQENGDVYDLAPTAPAGAAPPRQTVRAVRTAPVALGYRGSPKAGAPAFDEQRLKDLHLPLVLLCGGIVVEVAAALLKTRAFERAMREVGIQLVLGTLFMLTGIIPAARWRGIKLGQFWTVVLKLAAITVAPGAVVRLAEPALDFIPLGWLAGFIAEFVLYFALLGVLFDLDESDTWYCVMVIFLVRLAAYFLVIALL
jgi:hypothetical protein